MKAHTLDIRQAALALALSLLAMAFVLSAASIAQADHHAVKVYENSAYEKFLVDSKGMTLYWFKNDSTGVSACAGQCAQNWPVFYRETVAPVGEGISAADFGTITRGDGAKQTTFRGYPLYYFIKDTKPEDTMGNGVKSVWFTIDPTKFPPTMK